jgi:hypothetical protein
MANDKKKYETLKIGPFTGAYVQGLWEASAVQDGQEPKYNLTLLIPKNLDPKSPAGRSFAALKAKIDEVAKEKFGPASVAQVQKNVGGFKNYPIRDGDVDKPDKPEFAGMYFIGVKSKSQPNVVNRHLQRITDKEEIWSGCKFVVDAGVFSYEIQDQKTKKTVSKGVSVGMNHVLFFETGDRIDNRKSAEETFAEYAEDGAAGEGGGAPEAEESALD